MRSTRTCTPLWWVVGGWGPWVAECVRGQGLEKIMGVRARRASGLVCAAGALLFATTAV